MGELAILMKSEPSPGNQEELRGLDEVGIGKRPEFTWNAEFLSTRALRASPPLVLMCMSVCVWGGG